MGTLDLDRLALDGTTARDVDASGLSPCVHEAIRCLMASDGCDQAGGLTALTMTANACALTIEDVAEAVIACAPRLDAGDGAPFE